MTGRRLYDHFTDALGTDRWMSHGGTVLPSDQTEATTRPPVAWPFLASRDKAVWNTLARKLTPTKRKP